MNFLSDSEWLQILKIIDAVNDIDQDHEFRRTVLEELRLLIPYDSAAFFLTDLSKFDDPQISPLIDPVGINTPNGVLEEYIDSAWEANETRDTYPKTKSGVFKERDMVDSTQLEKSAYFHDYLDDFFVVTSHFACERGPLGSMNLNREKHREDFTDQEVYILKIIEPRITNRLRKRHLVQDTQPSIENDFFQEYRITRREQEVIYCLSQGMSNEEISEKLFISSGTAKKHVENIYRKTGCASRLALILLLNQHRVSA